MSQIQSNVGLITGIPIQDTVDQLMALAAQPRNRLQRRTDSLVAERSAIDQVSSLLLGFKFAASQLKSASLFSATTATSSDKNLLTATASKTSPPAAGSYKFTPLQTANAHQVVSSSFSDVASQLASGTVTLGVGGHVDRGIDLSQLNGGSGFRSGSIRITDRSGATADVDLRSALTIDDVLEAINGNSTVDVTASIDGDSIKLTDNTGGSGNLRVREVGIGTTAATLGLASINVAADEATGTDIFSLSDSSLLSTLNDGNGVHLRDAVDDLEVSLADSSTLSIDLGDATTLGNVIDAINAADPAKLSAAISADGNRIELTDLTSGGGTFAVTSVGIGTAAEELGLTETAAGGTITGRRLVSGLQDTLVSTLNGGQGFGTLGSIDIVDRDGNPAVTVDLSSAETLGDIVTAINDSGALVTAAVNSARNGIVLTDTSGGTGNLTITNADANNTADALGLAIDDAVASINSGTLNRATISLSTRLETLNGGSGVKLGDFYITDSNGVKQSVSLNDVGAEAETIGDVIDAINGLSNGVEASINATGDGILITDTAGGSGTLTITETTNGRTAADLRLVGASTETDEGGQQIINGTTHFEIDLSTLDTSGGVALSSLNDGNGITLGTFSITDSNGGVIAVQLDEAGNEAFTVEDVIDLINDKATTAGVGVTASLNSSGTGILLTDTAGGSGKLTVEDLGSGTAAAQLKIAGEATTTTINGSGLFSAQDADQNALDSLAEAINELNAGFTASAFFDGVGYRLSITGDSAGRAQELLIDTSLTGVSFDDVSRPRDAVVQLGDAATGGVIVTSNNNKFSGIVAGLDITVKNASDSPVTVEVAADDSKFVGKVEDFVEAYNSLRTTLDELTSFDAESLTTGLLFGRGEALRVEIDLTRVITGAFTSSSTFRSLQEVGISLDAEGQLSLDKTKLQEAFDSNSDELERFLTKADTGVISRFNAVIDRLASDENSVLTSRSDALGETIETNQSRIENMDEVLERERERTLLEFYRLEETIARLQTNLSALESFQAIPPLSIRRSNG